MPLVFIYARYSSDRQQDRSIEDQIALTQAYCERKGYQVANVFADRAKSGASAIDRFDYKRMIAAAAAGNCDVIVAEDLDRLSRNQADIAHLHERMTFAGVAIETVADGLVNEMHVGLKGTMNALFLKNLALKVHRGMAGVVREGRHAGGLAYGYRPVKGDPGRLEIVVEEAEVVRRIFRDYLAGKPARMIAAELNAEGVPPPRKSFWRASTISGHGKRKTGILQNELYCGRLVWNRVRMVKNPDTGKRISRVRPETEWQRRDVPHLRIIDVEIFDQAQGVRSQRAHNTHWRARPKHLFSGLLRCGCCGAGMSKKDSKAARPRVECSRRHEAGNCENRHSYYLDNVERIVVGGLREQLGSEEAIRYFIKCYNDERQRKAAGGSDKRRTIAAKLAEVERQLERAVGAIIAGRITEEEAAAHMPALRRRRAELSEDLAAIDGGAKLVSLRPAAVELYRQRLIRLEEAVNTGLANGQDETAKAIRSMIQTVTIMPTPAGEIPGVIVKGDLAPILDLGQHEPRAGVMAGSGGRI
jgi:site-specific DNA recombinase